MKQNFTKLTLLFAAFLLSASLYGQRVYSLSVDGQADSFLALDGSFGPCVQEVVSGELVMGAPAEGCEALTNPDELVGKIAILDRGTCGFIDKVGYAQAAGAIAAIICNNRPESEDGGGVIVMGGDDSLGLITIPSFMVSQEECAVFRTSIPAAATINPPVFDSPTVVWGGESGQGDFSGGLNGWTALTIECNGAPSEEATWIWEQDGLADGGSFSTGVTVGPTFCNGAMVFDSDFLDNKGDQSFGEGVCPSDQIGELISPSIDLSVVDVAGVSVQFYQDTRQFQSRYFVEYSIDGGENYTAIEINTEIPVNEFGTQSKVTVPLPGAVGASDVKIKFTYVANYYYWIIDDVTIVEREANNLRVNENFFATAPNVKVPKSQVDAINFLADISNIGAATQDNVVLGVLVFDDVTGEEVFIDSLNLGSITPDSTAENNLFPNTFTPPMDVASYTGVYVVGADAEDFDESDDTRTIHFEVTENEFANEDGIGMGNIQISDANAIPTWAMGNYFYVPNGDGWKVTAFGIGIGNAEEVIGLDVGVRMFKWTDIDADSDGSGFPEAAPNERELIAFADYEIIGNELTDDINIISVDDPDDKILLENGGEYLVALTADAAIGISAKEDLYNSYLAMNLASSSAGKPRFWSFFGDNSDIGEAIYDMNNNFTPLVRMYIAPENASAVQELSADNLIAISPNPAQSVVTLNMQFVNAMDEVHIMVTDMTGRMVLSREFTNTQNEQYQFDVSNLAAGTFMVNVRTPEGVRTERFVKID